MAFVQGGFFFWGGGRSCGLIKKISFTPSVLRIYSNPSSPREVVKFVLKYLTQKKEMDLMVNIYYSYSSLNRSAGSHQVDRPDHHIKRDAEPVNET